MKIGSKYFLLVTCTNENHFLGKKLSHAICISCYEDKIFSERKVIYWQLCKIEVIQKRNIICHAQVIRKFVSFKSEKFILNTILRWQPWKNL